jgi:catechol 2,3-dioxygenase-like lactoylglutathione lyase family enzyme
MNKHSVISIDHIAVQTSDLDKAVRFYIEILGAILLERRSFKRRQMAWLKVGETKIELFSKRDGEMLEAWNDFYSGPVHIAFRVGNLDKFLSEALANGARFHPSHPAPFVPPVQGATKIAYLLGPDGEEVEIRDQL